MKIRAMEAELFHAKRRMDRQTDSTKLIVAFRNFVNAPKMTYFRDEDQLVCLCDGIMEMRRTMT
jgi:hypothetical protein